MNKEKNVVNVTGYCSPEYCGSYKLQPINIVGECYSCKLLCTDNNT